VTKPANGGGPAPRKKGETQRPHARKARFLGTKEPVRSFVQKTAALKKRGKPECLLRIALLKRERREKTRPSLPGGSPSSSRTKGERIAQKEKTSLSYGGREGDGLALPPQKKKNPCCNPQKRGERAGASALTGVTYMEGITENAPVIQRKKLPRWLG